MVELGTFGPDVYVISDHDICRANNVSTNKKGRYVAPSNCILVEITGTSIKVAVGKSVPTATYQNLLGLALNNGKRLELVECEDIRNLRTIDTLIDTYNTQFALYI
jgi:hypothetical protein